MKIMKDKEIALVKEILRKLGASEEDCELVAEATIDADLKGFTSHGLGRFPQDDRSEERRVGKECRSRWSPYH